MERPLDTMALLSVVRDVWRELLIIGLTVVCLLLFLAFGWYDLRSVAGVLTLLAAVIVLEVW